MWYLTRFLDLIDNILLAFQSVQWWTRTRHVVLFKLINISVLERERMCLFGQLWPDSAPQSWSMFDPRGPGRLYLTGFTVRGSRRCIHSLASFSSHAFHSKKTFLSPRHDLLQDLYDPSCWPERDDMGSDRGRYRDRDHLLSLPFIPHKSSNKD